MSDCRFRAANNPRELRHYGAKFLLVALLVSISLRTRTVNAAMLETFLLNELNLLQLNSLQFQKDRGSAHHGFSGTLIEIVEIIKGD